MKEEIDDDDELEEIDDIDVKEEIDDDDELEKIEAEVNCLEERTVIKVISFESVVNQSKNWI